MVAVGAESNTFGIPGVTEYAHFLKVCCLGLHECLTKESVVEIPSVMVVVPASHYFICYEGRPDLACPFAQEVENARQIHKTILDNFERASLPTTSDEEKKRLLHFVIVGGGPTGVETAAEVNFELGLYCFCSALNLRIFHLIFLFLH